MAQEQLQPQQEQQGIELLLYDDPHSEYTAKVSTIVLLPGAAPDSPR
jgi:hypothetical protein